MSDRIIQAYYGEYPRINKRTPVDITARITSDHCASLFEAIKDYCNIEPYGYKIGDYFIGPVSGYKYILADLDTFYGRYSANAVIATHHIGIVVDMNTTTKWHDGSSVANIGYKGSTIRTNFEGTYLSNIKSDLVALTGEAANNHLLSHDVLWSNGYADTYDTTENKWEWSNSTIPTGVQIIPLTELQVFGSVVLSGNRFQQGEGVRQLEVFRKYNFNEMIDASFWLRSLFSNSLVCQANNTGFVNRTSISNAYRAVGLILLGAS